MDGLLLCRGSSYQFVDHVFFELGICFFFESPRAVDPQYPHLTVSILIYISSRYARRVGRAASICLYDSRVRKHTPSPPSTSVGELLNEG